jgi:carbamoyltransferase
MITLGINAALHDSAAALVVDGEVVAAAEEERFTRIKHGKRPVPFTTWELPFHAIDYCLGEAGVTLAEVDHVAYSFDPAELDGGAAADDAATIALPVRPGRSRHAGPSWQSPWDPLFLAYIRNAPAQLVDGVPHHLARRFAGVDSREPPYRWHFVGHHLAHQASAFLAAPFERCAVMTLDGRGERATTTYGACSPTKGALAYRSLGVVEMPNSLGLLYEKITAHLGFLHSSDEYKVMALAALGTPTLKAALRDHVHVGAGGQYVVEPFDAEALFGPRRRRGGRLEQQPHLDLAASLQDVLEETVLSLAPVAARGERRAPSRDGGRRRAQLRDELAPAATAASSTRSGCSPPPATPARPGGAACGWTRAAVATATDQRRLPARRLRRHPPRPRRSRSRAAGRCRTRTSARDFDDARDRAHARLGQAAVPALSRRRRARRSGRGAARRGQDHRLVPGPHGIRPARARRALDPRLADRPGHAGAAQRAQGSRGLRPVAPAIPREDLPEWFAPADANGGTSPFMLFVYDVPAEQAARIPSACHSDRSARVQTVDAGPTRASTDCCARSPAHRRARARQHLVQRARRADRRLAQGRGRGVLQHAARRPRDRPLHRREDAMSSLTHGGTTPSTHPRAAPVRPALHGDGVRVSVVIPTFRRRR